MLHLCCRLFTCGLHFVKSEKVKKEHWWLWGNRSCWVCLLLFSGFFWSELPVWSREDWEQPVVPWVSRCEPEHQDDLNSSSVEGHWQLLLLVILPEYAQELELLFWDLDAQKLGRVRILSPDPATDEERGQVCVGSPQWVLAFEMFSMR